MKILFVGGGTLGPVTPLLAVAEALRQQAPNTEMFWIGTPDGPEHMLVTAAGIEFYSLNSGKLRRYLDWRNLVDLFKLCFSFFKAFYLLMKFKPDVVMSAGGFVAVPVVWSAWIQGRHVVIHQLDLLPGLANRLSAPLAELITVGFRELLPKFPKNKTIYTGNPVRQIITRRDRNSAVRNFGFDPSQSVLLVLGGGTGALKLNHLVVSNLPVLASLTQIIHLTGRGKNNLGTSQTKNYRALEFMGEDIVNAFGAADLVVTRAGLGTLSELAVLEKPIIIVPMPKTHQEINAQYFVDRGAAMLVEQGVDSEEFIGAILRGLNDTNWRKLSCLALTKIMPKDASLKIATLILTKFNGVRPH